MINLSTPDQLFPSLFHEVQMARVFSDSKTFVDCIPKSSIVDIKKAYHLESQEDEFQLKSFVMKHFDLPSNPEVVQIDKSLSINEHLHQLWSKLCRSAEKTEGSSLIALPYPFVVPGGRFREIYYWDSYFTMLGLIESNRIDLIKNMVDNFAYLIQEIGHIPNGNRTYFLSRSQPPFFAMMVELLVQYDPNVHYKDYLDVLVKEYNFWMDGPTSLNSKSAYRRVVNMNRQFVNRYYDDAPIPRQESYYEDVLDAQNLENKTNFYRHLRAACESGWDFSSRWLKTPNDLTSIETCNLIPVDLNCLLYKLESVIAIAYDEVNKKELSILFKEKSTQRSLWIQENLWDSEQESFCDYNFTTDTSTGRLTAAMLFPLFVGIASPNQAQSVIHLIERDFLKSGGLLTTLEYTSQQWDAPNGWPPLQWVAFVSLRNYGFHGLAMTLKDNWCASCETKFDQDHKMIEKYNVVDALTTAKGGEYDAQDGFGWSNGVYLAMKNA